MPSIEKCHRATCHLGWRDDNDLLEIRKHLLIMSETHTATPVRADAKHSFPILALLCGHATGERFGFPAISTADETPGTPQAEPAKLAHVEVLPQLQEDIPDVQPEPKHKDFWYECIMYLVVEGQSCQVAVGRLERTEICVGEECEYVKDELVI